MGNSPERNRTPWIYGCAPATSSPASDPFPEADKPGGSRTLRTHPLSRFQPWHVRIGRSLSRWIRATQVKMVREVVAHSMRRASKLVMTLPSGPRFNIALPWARTS